MPIRVAVAEDNYLVREGVVRLLGIEPDVEVVAAYEDFDALIAGVSADPPDVVITDIRMPPTGTDEGVRAANLIHESHPSVGVVVLSQYVEPDYALAAELCERRPASHAEATASGSSGESGAPEATMASARPMPTAYGVAATAWGNRPARVAVERT